MRHTLLLLSLSLPLALSLAPRPRTAQSSASSPWRGGLLLTAGSVYRAWGQGGHAIELQGQGGLKWRTIPAATNQDANWLRIPVEGLVFYRAPIGIRLGAGATWFVPSARKGR